MNNPTIINKINIAIKADADSQTLYCYELSDNNLINFNSETILLEANHKWASLINSHLNIDIRDYSCILIT